MSAASRRAMPGAACSWCGQPRQRGDRGRFGARPAEGPADEGRAVDGDHPRPAAAGIRHRIAEAAERSAADGLGVRQAPHDGGARRRLAEEVRKLRASAGRRRFARPGASCALARRRGAGLQAAISRHAVGGRSRPGAARVAARDPPPHGSAIDTTEIGKEIGARVREELDYRREAKHVALYREMLASVDIVRVPRAWPELSTGRLLTLDWLDGTKLLAHRTDPLEARNRWRPRCSPPGGCRSAASA